MEEQIFNQDHTIFVGNLHEDVTRELLYELFIQFTLIRNIKMPVDKLSGKHQGYCLIELHNSNDVDFVTQLFQTCRNKIQLFQQFLKVSKTIQSTSGSEYVVPAIISIYNLINSSGTSDLESGEELDDTDTNTYLKRVKSIFQKFGELVDEPKVVEVPTSSSSSSSSSSSATCINVHFTRFQNADDAIKNMNGNLILDKQIKVEYALKDPNDVKSRRKHGDDIERYLEKQAIKNNVI